MKAEANAHPARTNISEVPLNHSVMVVNINRSMAMIIGVEQNMILFNCFAILFVLIVKVISVVPFAVVIGDHHRDNDQGNQEYQVG